MSNLNPSAALLDRHGAALFDRRSQSDSAGNGAAEGTDAEACGQAGCAKLRPLLGVWAMDRETVLPSVLVWVPGLVRLTGLATVAVLLSEPVTLLEVSVTLTVVGKEP